ncbi:KH domain-containing protein [Patescibacteria group bacterium]
MKEFIEYILQQIVSNPDDIKVNEVTQDGFTTFEIDINENDMGLAIGKSGRTIRSIRSLVKAKAIKDGVRVKVDLIEKNPPEEVPQEPSDD